MNRRVFISRRGFLGKVAAMAAVGVGASFVQACGPAATPTPVPPTATTAPAPKPTEAPKAVASPAATEAPKPTAAAATAPATKQVQLTFTARIGPQSEHFDAFGKLFMEKYPNVKYVPQHIPTNDWPQKILVLAAGGTLPEVVYTYLSYFKLFQHRGLFQDLTPQIKAQNVDLKQWYPIAIDTLTDNGKLYGIPWISHPGRCAVFFNKALFAASNVKLPTEKWTWEDLTTAAISLTKRNGNRIEQFGYAPDTTLGGYHMDMRSFGGEYVSVDGKKSVSDSPESIKAIQVTVADMYNKNKVAPTPDLIEGGTPQMFGSKKVAMFQSGYWGIADIMNYAKDIDWDVVPLPLEPNGKLGTLGEDCNSVSSSAKEPETGALFCVFMGSKEAGIDIAKRGSVPGARPDVWDSPELANTKGHMVFAKAEAVAIKHNILANLRDAEFQTTFEKGLDPLRFGQEGDAGKVLKALAPSLQAIVDKPAD